MMNHRSLRHSILQDGGTTAGAHRAPWGGIRRRRAVHGILALGLTLGSFAVAAVALLGHAGASPAQTSAHQRANSPAHHVALHKTSPKPWMY